MGKFTDALKPIEEFRAPWETADGSEAEIDKSKLKRFIYGLVSDKAKAQDAREDALESVKTLESDLEDAKKEAANANGEEATKKIDKLERALAEAKQKVEEMESAQEIAELRAEALKDIDPKYHEWIKGDTEDELQDSVKKFKETFGIEDPDPDADPEDEDQEPEPTLRTRPRSRLANPADPDHGKPGEKEIDFDKVADDIIGAGSIF